MFFFSWTINKSGEEDLIIKFYLTWLYWLWKSFALEQAVHFLVILVGTKYPKFLKFNKNIWLL